MYPGDTGGPGSDFSGIVVDGTSAGHAVFGLAPGCLASHVLCSSQTVAFMPPTITFEQAASTPTTCLTVDVALRHVAQLQAGDTLLLHGASGGVGLAAVQLAAAAGASVIATAGSPGKRTLLRKLGVEFAISSRMVSPLEPINQLHHMLVRLSTSLL